MNWNISELHVRHVEKETKIKRERRCIKKKAGEKEIRASRGSFNLPCEPPGKIKPSWKKARARHFYLQKIFRAHRDCAQNIIDFRWKIRMQDEKVGGGHIVYCTGSKPLKADWKSKIMRVASESGSTYLDLAPRSATWSRTWTGDVFC